MNNSTTPSGRPPGWLSNIVPEQSAQSGDPEPALDEGLPALAAPGSKHPAFDLPMHEDRELEALIGAPITSRATLHEWPLSCVQRIETAGEKLIYKSQGGPTLEPEFYAAATSPLLVEARCLHRSAHHAVSLIEHIDAPLLRDFLSDPSVCLAFGRELTDAIAKIEGAVPCFRDLSSSQRWLEFMDGLGTSLRELSSRGLLPSMAAEDIDDLLSTGRSAGMRELFDAPAQLLHGDLKGDNVFKTSEGFKVIDWQFPRRGPAAVDQAILLESAGHDPAPLLGVEALRSVYLIRMEWFAQCSLRWIPAGRQFYDGVIAGLAKSIAQGKPLA